MPSMPTSFNFQLSLDRTVQIGVCALEPSVPTSYYLQSSLDRMVESCAIVPGVPTYHLHLSLDRTVGSCALVPSVPTSNHLQSSLGIIVKRLAI